MTFRRLRLSDLFGDFVTYRNLEPGDARLRGLSSLRSELGLPAGRIPRKAEPEFATVVVNLLRQAQSARGAARPLERLLYIGDTRLNDGTAARNLGQHLPWRALIAEDKLYDPPAVETLESISFANRWAAVDAWLDAVERQGWALDESLAVVLDLDKTAIGARGRNDKPIDQARVDAALETVRATMGIEFPIERFRPIYDELHKSMYHSFTTDNQDYVVYISLMTAAGVYDFKTLLADLQAGRMASLQEFVAACGRRIDRGDFAMMRPIQAEVSGNVQRGDPTPFKSFRYREYAATVARMDALPDDTPREYLLAKEITVTGEIAKAASRLRERGVLLFALSDKPDEASLPTPELAARGQLPLHRVTMKVCGPS